MLSDLQCILNVPPSWSFVNGLLNYVVKELNVEEALKSSILVVHKAAAVPLSWSFLNGLLNHVIKELNVEEVLKSPFFVQRYIFLKWYRFISPVRYPGYQFSSLIFSRSNRQFTFKILISSPHPPNNYFLLHFSAIISPKNLKFTHF